MNEPVTAEPADPKAQVGESVTLETGEVVVFAGKRRMLKSTVIDEATGKVTTTFKFRNGKVLTYSPIEELISKFVGHGVEQKIGDETAGTADVDDMVEDVGDLIERLNKGEWSAERASGGFAGQSVLLRALVEVSGKTEDEIRAFLKTKKPAEKQAMRNSDRLKAVVARLESEKQAKAAKVDTTELFGQIGLN